MRIISGALRGKRLKSLDGVHTRPTTDRVKEGMFSAVQFHLPGARVLDLFGGSGQLAIESISRGAKEAIVVENSRVAFRVIRENIASTGAERIRPVFGDSLKFLSSCEPRSFDLVFVDPPYGGKLLENALFELERFDILSRDGIIICESDVETHFRIPGTFKQVKQYRYGAIRIFLLERDPSRDEEGL